MKVASLLYKTENFIKEKNEENLNFDNAHLVLGFGSSELVSKKESFEKIKDKFPNAQIAICSSAGEIYDVEVLDDTIFFSCY